MGETVLLVARKLEQGLIKLHARSVAEFEFWHCLKTRKNEEPLTVSTMTVQNVKRVEDENSRIVVGREKWFARRQIGG